MVTYFFLYFSIIIAYFEYNFIFLHYSSNLMLLLSSHQNKLIPYFPLMLKFNQFYNANHPYHRLMFHLIKLEQSQYFYYHRYREYISKLPINSLFMTLMNLIFIFVGTIFMLYSQFTQL